MNNIKRVGNRNGVRVTARRYNLSQIISESYRTLYECELNSPLYRLAESHIENVKRNPQALSKLSRDLDTLKGLVKLGESAIIRESDIPEEEDFIEESDDFEDEILEEEDIEDEELEEVDFSDEEDLEEDADLEVEKDKDVINEDSDLETEEDRDVIDEDADLEVEEDEDVINEEDEITPEELDELKRHLKEMRSARRRVKESATSKWSTEKASMRVALKNFCESSNKKAFFKSFIKLQESLNSGREMTLQESILLYKASNSAMTHLTVELEHNPGFIYTFRECTKILAADNAKLLESICQQKSPSKSLTESYRAFSHILLESDDVEDDPDDELVEEEEEILSPEEEEVKESEDSAEEDEEVLEEEDDIEDESENEIPLEEEEEDPAEEDVLEEEEDPVEDVVDDELNEEETEELDPEITDEEAEELKKKLAEMRASRKHKKS